MNNWRPNVVSTGDMEEDEIVVANDEEGEALAAAAAASTHAGEESSSPTKTATPATLKTRRGTYKKASLLVSKRKSPTSRTSKKTQAESQEEAVGASLVAAENLLKDVSQALATTELEQHVGAAAIREVDQLIETLQALPKTAMQPRRKTAANRALETKVTQLETAREMVRSKLIASTTTPLGAPTRWQANSGRRGSLTEATDTLSSASVRERAASTSGPTWQGLDGNPYTPNRCNLKPQYWEKFPFPWNVQPQKAALATEIFRIGSANLPKLRGHEGEYIAWRSAFLPTVHRSSIDVGLKVLILIGTIDPKTPQMEEIKNNVVCNERGYRNAITLIERTFGGEDNLLITRQRALMALPTIKEGDYATLELLHIRLGTFLIEWGGVEGEGVEVDSLSFFHVLMAKVDPPFARKYADWVRQTGDKRGLQSLHDWAEEQLEDHRFVKTFATSENPKPVPFQHKTPATFGRWRGGGAQKGNFGRHFRHETITDTGKAMGGAHGTPKSCPMCDDKHQLSRCPQFRQADAKERKEFLTQQRRCYACFQEGHNANNCRLGYKCYTCGDKHHTMLHEARPRGGQRQRTFYGEATDTEGAGEALEFHYKHHEEKKERISLRTVGVWVSRVGSNVEEYVNALLDDGSTSSALVGVEIAKRLQLKGHLVRTTTEGVGGQITEGETLISRIKIRSNDGRVARIIPAQVFAKPAGTYAPIDWDQEKTQFPHLRSVEFPPISKTWPGVQVLLGNKNSYLHTTLEERAEAEDQPVARKTPLGWTAVGPVTVEAGGIEKGQEESTSLLTKIPLTALAITEALREGYVQWRQGDVHLLERTSPTDRQLVKLLARLCEVELGEEREEMSPDELYLFKLMREKGQLKDGQWHLPCTWRPDGTRPASNYQQALGRLESLERSKYFRNEEVRRKYGEVIKEWAEEEFVHETTREAALHFLPHFPVLREESLTTSLRVVMDCSVALNKHLLAGPKLMNDVAAVLLRFRSRPIAFTGDVSKMFLRIKMLPTDKPYHCFLWREREGDPIKIYEFQVHVFGNAGSPFVAIFAVREQAKKHAAKSPAAADTISNSSLVDDILDSADTVEEAAATLTEVRNILGEVGMEVRKCMSNREEVLSSLPRGARAKELLDLTAACTSDPQLRSLKTLGLRYDPSADVFLFEMEEPGRSSWTKRQVLRIFPKLYDPLGMLLPYTMRARCIFSAINKDKKGWDEELEPKKMKRWDQWLAQLRELRAIRVPRPVKTGVGEKQMQLHVFVDASSASYAAVAFIRVEYDGALEVRMIMARAKVAPPNPTTIPRMELLGAELGTQLGAQVQKHLKLQVQSTTYWSDSLNVLFWLRNQALRLQSFVDNRVRKIRSRTEERDWRWVPTQQNPADIPTRGRSPQELSAEHTWWEGPEFLWQAPSSWPIAPSLSLNEEGKKELRKIEQVFFQGNDPAADEVLPFQRVSSWKRLLGVAARCLRWKYNAVEAARKAEAAVLRQMQVGTLKYLQGKRWKAGCKELGMSKLAPFLDEAGLLRGRGRLQHVTQLPQDVRAPLYVPKGHPGTLLLLRHLHEVEARHVGGVSHTLARLQERFWLHQGRRGVYNVVTSCIPCKRRLARPTSAPQGCLPSFRVPLPEDKPVAFENTGIDCAGPFRVKRGRTVEQHYLLLLTCCKTRAVKLEWLSSLSVDSFLQALSRVAERGVRPALFLSDNGGNFEAANRMKGVLWEVLEKEKEKLEERYPLIQWKFNPPYASHYGGVFERLIGAAKRALYHALPATLSVTLEQLVTAFAIVEGTLNSRPLGYVGGGEEEAAPLTPNHFLYGSSSLPVYQVPNCPTTNLAKNWVEVQEIGDLYWKRLLKEVIPYLHKKTQVERQTHTNLRKGDIVVFLSEKERGRWPLARIVEVFPGPDGVVRTLELEMSRSGTCKEDQKKRFKRDITSVALLLPATEEQA